MYCIINNEKESDHMKIGLFFVFEAELFKKKVSGYKMMRLDDYKSQT